MLLTLVFVVIATNIAILMFLFWQYYEKELKTIKKEREGLKTQNEQKEKVNN